MTWKLVLVCSLYICIAKCGEHFSPLKDDILFRMNWAGPDAVISKLAPPGIEYNSEDSFVMTSSNKERYRCTLPTLISSDNSKTHSEEDLEKTPVQLLAPVFKSTECSYFVEPYWTYELCHGKHIRQYHEERIRKPSSKDGSSTLVFKTEDGKEIVIQNKDEKNDLVQTTEFFLGYLTDKVDKEGFLINPGKVPSTANDVTSKKLNGVKTPYFAVNMTEGTPCDLKSGTGRKSTVLYICGPDSRNELLSVAETSSCEYELIVLTPELCKHPLYALKGKRINEIHCVALEDAPSQPKALTEELFEQSKDASHTSRSSPSTDDSTKNDLRRVERTTISTLVDKSLLNDFLSGTYCLRGGAGWWRFEFCYGKHVVQYHDDKMTGRTTINVGHWNAQRHMEWTLKKSSKPIVHHLDKFGKRSIYQVAHFYGEGDICDKTNRPREVVVKMKCKTDSTSQHSVTIYLLEPSTCSYILGVESMIFCDLLESADEYGLFSLDNL